MQSSDSLFVCLYFVCLFGWLFLFYFIYLFFVSVFSLFFLNTSKIIYFRINPAKYIWALFLIIKSYL